MLSPAADVTDHASNGALRAIIKTEFTGKPNTHLVLRNLAGISATRIILVGLGKQDSYKAAAHAGAELVFANYCANAGLTDRSEEHTSELQSHMRISYAVFCLNTHTIPTHYITT